MESVPGLYLHVPFCRKVCPFCSFAVMRDNPSRHVTYLSYLKEELKLLRRNTSLDFSAVESIYIGGGTPSILNDREILDLLNWVDTQAGLNGDIQRSMEINPEDASLSYLERLKKAGITRISLGVQSFDDMNLDRLERQHSGKEALTALENVMHAGFDDLNIDLMLGFPGQSTRTILSDIKQALELSPKHISVYWLDIGPKSRWNRNADLVRWIEDNEAENAETYLEVSQYLTSTGFIHYEVSNFCRPGFESRQNSIYWNNKNWIGIGPGAHSHIHPHRWGNCRRLVDYGSLIELGKNPYEFYETLDTVQQRDEDLMLALRTKKGLHLANYADKHKVSYNDAWSRQVEIYMEAGLLVKNHARLIPTVKGFLMADEMSSSLALCFD